MTRLKIYVYTQKKVSINYAKLEAEAKWDGLKGYLTNTNIPVSEIYAAYHNLWHVDEVRAVRTFCPKKKNVLFFANKYLPPTPTLRIKELAKFLF